MVICRNSLQGGNEQICDSPSISSINEYKNRVGESYKERKKQIAEEPSVKDFLTS
jgi:hypothetical protein